MDVSIKEGVAHVSLNIPPVNALAARHWEELTQTLGDLGKDESIKVLLLSAQGRGFCAGVDIKELQADASLITRVNKACFEAFEAVHLFPVPVVAAVHGFCLGGGIGLVGSADVIFASTDATFGLPEIDRGAMGGASHLFRMVSPQKARRMFFTGQPATAQEMLAQGAVEEVLPNRNDLISSAHSLCENIAKKSPLALRLAKKALGGVEGASLERDYRFEQGFTLELYMSKESQHARDAFVKKTKGS